MYVQLTSNLAFAGGPDYSRSLSLDAAIAARVQVSVSDALGLSLVVIVQVSDDLRNWADQSRSSPYISGDGFHIFSVSDDSDPEANKVAARYLRLKYSGTGTATLNAGVHLNHA
jgi:hypothetical protein